MGSVLLNSFNVEQIRESVERNRRRLGQQHGDFEIVRVDYDWDVLEQINRVRCVHCGREKSVPNLSAFVRGKGGGRFCECRSEKKEKPPIFVKTQYSDCVGQTVNGFRLLSYEKGRGFRVECVECGKQKWAGGKAVLEGRVACNHQIVRVYDDSIIGQKFGHLTAIERSGKYFKFRCDCGCEKILRPTDVCRGSTTTCGRVECEYHGKYNFNPETKKAIEEGRAFERHLATVFEKAGYKVIKTPDSGDYGVDVIVEINGEKWAFQCKKKKVPAGSKAVAEAYAGGRYYDCTRFCVASPSGFTYQAKKMASKLGVQLETKSFHFNVPQSQYKSDLLPTVPIGEVRGRKNKWEIDGIIKDAAEWLKEYDISRATVERRMHDGMDLKKALTTPLYRKRALVEIDGVVKSKQEWCAEYGISPQLYDYRTKQAGLSPIEALTKENSCRA